MFDLFSHCDDSLLVGSGCLESLEGSLAGGGWVGDMNSVDLSWSGRNLRGMEGKDVILIGVIIAAIAIPIWAGENAGYAIIIEAFIWWAYMIGKSIGSD